MSEVREREFSLDSLAITRSLGFTNLGMHDPTGFCDDRGFAKSYLTKNGPVTVHLARIESGAEAPEGPRQGQVRMGAAPRRPTRLSEQGL